MLFSSHLLEEVEQVADHVTMISQGTIVLSAPLGDDQGIAPRRRRVPSLDEIFVAHVGVARRRIVTCVRPLPQSPGNSAGGIAGD